MILVGRYGLPHSVPPGRAAAGRAQWGRRGAARAPAAHTDTVSPQVVEDGYEFFAKRQLVTLFSAPNYCGEFDNAGAMMSVDETLMCSFQILKPAEKKKPNTTRPVTPPRGMITKQAKK